MPTDTFTVSAGTEDGGGWGRSATWPPTVVGVFTAEGDGTSAFTGHTGAGPYDTDIMCMRWDCSTIDDAATITGANLKLYVVGRTGMAGRYINAEWYEFGGEPTIGADWAYGQTNPIMADQLATALTTGAVNTFALTDFSGIVIDETAFTGIRVNTVAAAAPTGSNWIEWGTQEGGHPAQLEVTYTVGGGPPVTTGLSSSLDWHDHPRFIHRKAR